VRDEPLEGAMAELRGLVEVGRELRHRAGVKSRIPLAELLLFGDPPAALAPLGEGAAGLIAEELNVKRVRRVPVTLRSSLPDAEWVVREAEGVPLAALPRQPTEELAEEGLAREVARRLQQTRKELGLRYTEPVAITVSGPAAVYRALVSRRQELAHDLLAEPLELVEGPLPAGPDVREWDLDGLRFSARVARRP